jgi:hypothetical protein
MRIISIFGHGSSQAFLSQEKIVHGSMHGTVGAAQFSGVSKDALFASDEALMMLLWYNDVRIMDPVRVENIKQSTDETASADPQEEGRLLLQARRCIAGWGSRHWKLFLYRCRQHCCCCCLFFLRTESN